MPINDRAEVCKTAIHAYLRNIGAPHRRYLPDKRKRIFWAQLLKRTFKIDVLKCDKCGGRMKLVGVVFDQPTITTTLRALGLPVRAPPIAPARSRLVQLSKPTEDGSCLPFLTHVPRDGWEFMSVALLKGKLEHKVTRRLTKKWSCEG